MKVELDDLGFQRSPGRSVIRGISISIASGERCAIIGRSGAGKTTLLRLIAGLDRPTSGTIRFDGRDVSALPPHLRGVSLAFQNPALLPHATVREHLELGLRASVDRSEPSRLFTLLVDRLELGDLLDRRPAELSGGQRTRAALGRTLASRRRLVMLDEPFQALDAPARVALREILVDLVTALGQTLLVVTHDLADAAALGSRSMIIDGGALIQVGPTQELVEDPNSSIVLEMLSSRPWSRIPLIVESDSARTSARAIDPSHRGIAGLDRVEFHSSWSGRRVVLAIPPELRAADESRSPELRIPGEIERIEGIGFETRGVIRFGSTSLRVAPNRESRDREMRVDWAIPISECRWFDDSTGRRCRPESPFDLDAAHAN
ncbi:MAG: ABC transporter ATP-binding protein [Isosphaeraceae bacterium]|nr:ABC transporter ATP-binding protein [Isosphaeraceae bacterium]